MTIAPSAWEHAARRFEPAPAPPPPRWETPGALARALDRRIVQTPALDLIDTELVRLAGTRNGRLILSMPPQEGKSSRASRAFPLWLLTQRPDTRVGIVSYEHTLARTHSRAIRDFAFTHGDLLGMTVRPDLSAQAEWQLDGHDGGVYATGVGGAITGRPIDLLVLDDPVKDREQADSETYRDRVWDWWTDTGSTRLSPGAPVLLVLTRWHHDDLAGRLLAAEDGHLWREVNIPAQADHDPAEGETDPIGRQPGEFMVSARGRTTEEWEAIKIRSGPHTWGALYQGGPTPRTGDLFPATWARYEQPMWVESDDGSRRVHGTGRLVQSWDLAFKDTSESDYVVGQVWYHDGPNAYLLDQMRGRWSFTVTCEKLLALTARWPQATAKLIEDKANGPAVMSALRQKVTGMIPVEPRGSKYARAAAVSPLVHSRNVIVPAAGLAPWVEDFLEEAAGFPRGAHDDQVDTFSQAVSYLLLSDSTMTVRSPSKPAGSTKAAQRYTRRTMSR